MGKYSSDVKDYVCNGLKTGNDDSVTIKCPYRDKCEFFRENTIWAVFSGGLNIDDIDEGKRKFKF